MKTVLIPVCLGLSSLVLAEEGRPSVTLTDWTFSKTALDAQDAKWEKVTVPHCWNATDAQKGGGKETKGEDVKDDFAFGYYRGPGSYKTTFPTEWDPDKHAVFIRFNAVSSSATVHLNGKELGSHLGGFTAFGFDVTKELKKEGDNDLAVAASNAYRKDLLPLSGDFPVYGGMYRPVTIEARPKVCISPIADGGWGIQSYQRDVSAKSATLDVVTTVYNATGTKTGGSVAVMLKDKGGKTAAQQMITVDLNPGNNDIRVTLNVPNPHLWNGRQDPDRKSVV